ncbi:MAG: MarR family winged helix-turn-helix transcriptional regulator [Actinomycetes bacterium]
MGQRDAVDRLVEDWTRVDPGLDLSSVEVVTRLLRLAPVVERRLSERLAEHGLTLPEFRVLSLLRRADGPVPQRDLAGRLNLTAATVSIRLDALEEAGWVRRRPTGAGRALAVELTAAGTARTDEAVHGYLDAQTGLLGGLTGRERSSLGDLLRRLGERLDP